LGEGQTRPFGGFLVFGVGIPLAAVQTARHGPENAVSAQERPVCLSLLLRDFGFPSGKGVKGRRGGWRGPQPKARTRATPQGEANP